MRQHLKRLLWIVVKHLPWIRHRLTHSHKTQPVQLIPLMSHGFGLLPRNQLACFRLANNLSKSQAYHSRHENQEENPVESFGISHC
jgi:hypothetical protein